jgi:type IV secretion system protein TrbL
MSTPILTDITQQFHNATSGWHAYLFPIANKLFAMLALIEIAWAGIWWSLEKQDATSLWTEMLKRFVSIGIFYSILLYSNSWIPAIIHSFIAIGVGASGHTQLFPTDVMDQGVSIAGHIFKVFHETGLFSFGMSTLVGAFAGLTVLLSFAVMAGLLVVTLVESYIVLGAGILLLGFASSRLSSKFATNYISYAMSVGAKLFMLYLVLGVGGSLADSWIATFSELSKTDIAPFLEVAGGSLVYLFCTWAIPHKAESLMSGASNATLGGLIAATTAANAAASIVTGGVSGVARAVMGSGASGIEAMKQAHSIGKGIGGGFVGYAAGGLAASFNAASSTIGSRVGHHRSAHGAMNEKTANIKSFFAERTEKKAANQAVNNRPIRTTPPLSESQINSTSGAERNAQSEATPESQSHVPTSTQQPETEKLR